MCYRTVLNLQTQLEQTHMNAFFCVAVRTPIGRYGGALASVRTDDLAAIPLRALQTRNPDLDWSAVVDVILGCANQAGEDNRNVARMATLLSGLPQSIPGATVNRLLRPLLQPLLVWITQTVLERATLLLEAACMLTLVFHAR